MCNGQMNALEVHKMEHGNGSLPLPRRLINKMAEGFSG